MEEQVEELFGPPSGPSLRVIVSPSTSPRNVGCRACLRKQVKEKISKNGKIPIQNKELW